MNFENHELLEYQSLKHILARYTDSSLGAQLVEELSPVSHSAEIQRQFKLVEECLELIAHGCFPRFVGLVDISSLIERLSVEGTVLSPQEMLQTLGLLFCSQSVKKFLASQVKSQSSLSEIGKSIPDLTKLMDELKGKISEAGEVEDHVKY